MVVAISFAADISSIQAELPTWASDRIPSITRNALNDTIEDARFAEIDKIRGVFDRPTPYIERSPLFRKATKTDLTAEVYIRDEGTRGRSPASVLGPEVHGGVRRAKAFEVALRRAGVMRADEYAIPAIGQQRDQYGGLPGPLIVAILSQMKAFSEVGFMANPTARSAKRKRKVGRFFVPHLGGRQERGIGRLPRGIYERRGNRIRGVVMFVREPAYRKRYDFGQATMSKAARVFVPYWERHFWTELQKHTGQR